MHFAGLKLHTEVVAVMPLLPWCLPWCPFKSPHRLKTLDDIGNCQRPVFSLCVSQHVHKRTNLLKFELNLLLKLQDNSERKNTINCHTKMCAFRERPQNLILRYRNQIRGKLLVSQNYVTSEGASSHNDLYYQQLPITHNQVRFYANNYFE